MVWLSDKSNDDDDDDTDDDVGGGCCRHCLLHCGPVMTESMWWVASEAVRRAFNVTLYPLRQLMTPFHSSSENFYGDVGQVKVAVRQDATLTDCVRLQQLARQVRRVPLSYVNWLRLRG